MENKIKTPLSWRHYFLSKYGRKAWLEYRRAYRNDRKTFHTPERIEYQNYKKDFSLLSGNQ